jgi:hypothetical protein
VKIKFQSISVKSFIQCLNFTRLHCWFQQLEYQRQELLRERQQFHMEQLRAAEYRAKQLAAQQLTVEQQQRAVAMQQATTHGAVAPTESHG